MTEKEKETVELERGVIREVLSECLKMCVEFRRPITHAFVLGLQTFFDSRGFLSQKQIYRLECTWNSLLDLRKK